LKILVTGAPGFVGRHLTAELLRSGHEVVLTGVTRETVDIYGFGPRPVQKMDITDPAECRRILEECRPDAVIHLAGIAKTTEQNNSLLDAVNIHGPENVVRALSMLEPTASDQPRTFLFISSAFVYGEGFTQGTLLCSPSTPESPRGTYGQGKLAAEKLVREFDQASVQVYIARPFNHIGVGQETSFVVPALTLRIHDAKPGSVIETGNMNALRDFTDVRDVVRAYRLIVERRPTERVFVIGTGRAASIQTVFDLLNQLSGKSLRQSVADHLKRAESTAALIADHSLARETLGWHPEISLEQSIKDIWNERR
jgi:GDP-4-dehydro-6-deoxy-D-mannose reductase